MDNDKVMDNDDEITDNENEATEMIPIGLALATIATIVALLAGTLTGGFYLLAKADEKAKARIAQQATSAGAEKIFKQEPVESTIATIESTGAQPETVSTAANAATTENADDDVWYTDIRYEGYIDLAIDTGSSKVRPQPAATPAAQPKVSPAQPKAASAQPKAASAQPKAASAAQPRTTGSTQASVQASVGAQSQKPSAAASADSTAKAQPIKNTTTDSSENAILSSETEQLNTYIENYEDTAKKIKEYSEQSDLDGLKELYGEVDKSAETLFNYANENAEKDLPSNVVEGVSELSSAYSILAENIDYAAGTIENGEPNDTELIDMTNESAEEKFNSATQLLEQID